MKYQAIQQQQNTYPSIIGYSNEVYTSIQFDNTYVSHIQDLSMKNFIKKFMKI